MEYHTFVKFCNPDNDIDGFYAIPYTFINFDPLKGEVILPHEMEEDEDDEGNVTEIEGDAILPDGFVYLDDDEDVAYRKLALYLHLDDFSGGIKDEGNNLFRDGKREYLVLTDDEADEMWDERLENYIDDCMEIPESLKYYFDRDKWKRDARIDGRGPALSSYNGDEYDIDTEEGTFYIYRQN